MDAQKIDRAVLAGYDWGARTADIVAAIWPQRVKALVSVSGYLIVNLVANQQPLSPQAEHGWWYQYYFATDRGVRGYRQNTHDFNKLIWQEASPTWKFDDATYDRTAAAFANPDHVDIVIHNYRWRLGLAQGEPQYDDLDRKLAASPPITVPAITIGSDFDGPQQRRCRLPQDVHRSVLAPHPRRHRAQRAARGAASVRGCRRRGRQSIELSMGGVATVGYERRTVDELITALTRQLWKSLLTFGLRRCRVNRACLKEAPRGAFAGGRHRVPASAAPWQSAGKPRRLSAARQGRHRTVSSGAEDAGRPSGTWRIGSTGSTSARGIDVFRAGCG